MYGSAGASPKGVEFGESQSIEWEQLDLENPWISMMSSVDWGDGTDCIVGEMSLHKHAHLSLILETQDEKARYCGAFTIPVMERYRDRRIPGTPWPASPDKLESST